MRIRIYLKCAYPPFQLTSVDVEFEGNRDATTDEVMAYLETQGLPEFSYVSHESLRNWGKLK